MSEYQITWKGFTIATNYHDVYDPGLPGAEVNTNTKPWQVLGQPISNFKAPPPDNGGGFWFPQNVSVNENGNLQLVMTDNGPWWNGSNGKTTAWTSAEAVFSETLNDGVYCVVAEVLSSNGTDEPWPSFIKDFNTTFGMFTYQKVADSEANPNHELDITEVGKVTNPSNEGDAQFVAQPFNAESGNLERYSLNMSDISSGGNKVTFWMNWQGENEEVLFAAQPGDHRSTTMPTSPAVSWTMENTAYSPSVGSAQLHINLWVNGGPVDGLAKKVAVDYLAIPGKTSDDG